MCNIKFSWKILVISYIFFHFWMENIIALVWALQMSFSFHIVSQCYMYTHTRINTVYRFTKHSFHGFPTIFFKKKSFLLLVSKRIQISTRWSVLTVTFCMTSIYLISQINCITCIIQFVDVRARCCRWWFYESPELCKMKSLRALPSGTVCGSQNRPDEFQTALWPLHLCLRIFKLKYARFTCTTFGVTSYVVRPCEWVYVQELKCWTIIFALENARSDGIEETSKPPRDLGGRRRKRGRQRCNVLAFTCGYWFFGGPGPVAGRGWGGRLLSWKNWALV